MTGPNAICLEPYKKGKHDHQGAHREIPVQNKGRNLQAKESTCQQASYCKPGE
jgi:hypothetical protein